MAARAYLLSHLAGLALYFLLWRFFYWHVIKLPKSCFDCISDELIKAVLNFCSPSLFYYLFCLGAGSHYVGEVDLKIVILLP